MKTGTEWFPQIGVMGGPLAEVHRELRCRSREGWGMRSRSPVHRLGCAPCVPGKKTRSLGNWGTMCCHGSRPGPGHKGLLFWEHHAWREMGSHFGGFQVGECNVTGAAKQSASFCGEG